MVDQTQITEWKKQYGSVYKASISGQDYIYRTVSRDDYIELSTKQLENPATFDYELETVKKCLLDPVLNEDELKRKGGLITVLSEQIMLNSGFQQVESEEL